MKKIQSPLGSILCWVVLAALLFSTGCAPTTAPEVVAAATNAGNNAAVPTTVVPEKVDVEPTETMRVGNAAVENTATPTAAAPETAEAVQATNTPEAPTAQPTEEASTSTGQVEKGFSAWCLPLDTSVSYAKDPLNPPNFAKKATFANNVLQVRNLPVAGCMFLVTFDKAAPTGLQLEVYEVNATTPFFKAGLQPVDGSPETLWAFVQHGAIVSPSVASSSFSIVVKDPLGQELQKAQLKLNSWVPGNEETNQDDDDDDCGCAIPLPPPPPDE